jgi:soluble lytic murein transglycosylase-like protein
MKQFQRDFGRVLFAFLCAAPSAAFAQVLEIARDGTVSRLGYAAPAAAHASASACADELRSAFEEAARRYDLSVELVEAVAQTESNCAAGAVSPAGALGVMQLTPATAHDLGIDARNAAQNIFGGAAYLRQQIDRFGGRLDLALAAYNAGPSAVESHNAATAYAETRQYVARNLNLLAEQSLQQTGTNQ